MLNVKIKSENKVFTGIYIFTLMIIVADHGIYFRFPSYYLTGRSF